MVVQPEDGYKQDREQRGIPAAAIQDEVKNYLFRCSVNATTFLRRLEAEGICVQNAV